MGSKYLSLISAHCYNYGAKMCFPGEAMFAFKSAMKKRQCLFSDDRRKEDNKVIYLRVVQNHLQPSTTLRQVPS